MNKKLFPLLSFVILLFTALLIFLIRPQTVFALPGSCAEGDIAYQCSGTCDLGCACDQGDLRQYVCTAFDGVWAETGVNACSVECAGPCGSCAPPPSSCDTTTPCRTENSTDNVCCNSGSKTTSDPKPNNVCNTEYAWFRDATTCACTDGPWPWRINAIPHDCSLLPQCCPAPPPPRTCNYNRSYTECDACPTGYSHNVDEYTWSDGSGVCNWVVGACNILDPGCGSPPPPPPTCGNGTVDAGEACDNGGSNGSCPATCSTSCTLNNCPPPPPPPSCGNGVCDSSIGEDCNTCSTDCGSCAPPPGCTPITVTVSPNPASPGTADMTFRATSSYAYTNVGMNTGGGTSAAGERSFNVVPAYTWTWVYWNATSTPGTYNASFSGFKPGVGTCSATTSYIVQGPQGNVWGRVWKDNDGDGTWDIGSEQFIKTGDPLISSSCSISNPNFFMKDLQISYTGPYNWANSVDGCNDQPGYGSAPFYGTNQIPIGNYTFRPTGVLAGWRIPPPVPVNLAAGETKILWFGLNPPPENLRNDPPPACSNTPYTINLRWDNTTQGVSSLWLDIDVDDGNPMTPEFSTYYHKDVTTQFSTQAPTGFNPAAPPFNPADPILRLNPNTTYIWRIWNGVVHTSTASFFVPFCPGGTLTANPNPCNIISGSSCTSNITWTTSNVSSPVVCVNIGAGYNLFASGISGTQPAIIQDGINYAFRLFENACSSPFGNQVDVYSIRPPWIQTSGGDVHSNTGINAPYGP